MNIVNGAAFIELISHTYPEYPLALIATIQIESMTVYALESINLTEHLKDVDSVVISITANLWTSIAHDAYLGNTAHFVTQNGVLQTKLLDCIEMAADPHTAEDTADLLKERFAIWGTDGKVFTAISDNSQNMVKALRDIMTISVFFGCFAHTVNLAVKKGLECDQMNPPCF